VEERDLLTAEMFRRKLAEDVLCIAIERVDVKIRRVERFLQVDIQIDGGKPTGVHRERIHEFALLSGGREGSEA